jgi:hypothetical protein
MAAIIEKIKTYSFSNANDYIISQDTNLNGDVEDTIEITGSVAKILQSRLDENDSALGLLPTTSGTGTNLANLTDGDPNTYGVVTHTMSQPDWVKIDLGSIIQVKKINLKHIYQGNNRRYKSVAIAISSDDVTYTFVYNNNKVEYPGLPELLIGPDNEYNETVDGKDIYLNNLDARYIKIYGFGSYYNNNQTEIREIEIYQASKLFK